MDVDQYEHNNDIMRFRKGSKEDIIDLKELALRSWTQYEYILKEEHWKSLYQTINSIDTYKSLLRKAECFICETEVEQIIGMAFLVPSGNPDEIYENHWCHIRFVTVDPKYNGLQIGEKLTKICLEQAKQNNEKIVALHTSEIMSAARYIYEKLDFKIEKELKPRLGVRYWLYTLHLVQE